MGSRWKAKRLQTEHATIAGDDATMYVIGTRRRVRIVVNGWMGESPADAAINLDDASVEKLIRRLTNILTNRRQQAAAKERKNVQNNEARKAEPCSSPERRVRSDRLRRFVEA